MRRPKRWSSNAPPRVANQRLNTVAHQRAMAIQPLEKQRPDTLWKPQERVGCRVRSRLLCGLENRRHLMIRQPRNHGSHQDTHRYAGVR